MASSTIRPVRLLAALAVAGVLLVGAGTGAGAAPPAACHGLSPASAVNCPSDVFAP